MFFALFLFYLYPSSFIIIFLLYPFFKTSIILADNFPAYCGFFLCSHLYSIGSVGVAICSVKENVWPCITKVKHGQNKHELFQSLHTSIKSLIVTSNKERTLFYSFPLLNPWVIKVFKTKKLIKAPNICKQRKSAVTQSQDVPQNTLQVILSSLFRVTYCRSLFPEQRT